MEKQTKYFKIVYDEYDKSVEKLFSSIEKAEEKYSDIFKIKPKEFKIIVVYSREEFNKKVGFQTDKWVDGYVKGKNLVMFSPSIRDKFVKTIGGNYWEYDYFFDHEINHFFYISLVGSYNPVWLSEGYATFMMKENNQVMLTKDEIKKLKNPESYLLYKYIKKSYFKYAHEFYSISFYLIKYLIENFGHERVLELIRQFAKKPYKKDLENNFKKIFKMSIENAIMKSIN